MSITYELHVRTTMTLGELATLFVAPVVSVHPHETPLDGALAEFFEEDDRSAAIVANVYGIAPTACGMWLLDDERRVEGHASVMRGIRQLATSTDCDFVLLGPRSQCSGATRVAAT